jgi:hypothetical protein
MLNWVTKSKAIPRGSIANEEKCFLVQPCAPKPYAVELLAPILREERSKKTRAYCSPRCESEDSGHTDNWLSVVVFEIRLNSVRFHPIEEAVVYVLSF